MTTRSYELGISKWIYKFLVSTVRVIVQRSTEDNRILGWSLCGFYFRQEVKF